MDFWTIFLLPFLSISRALRDCSRRRPNSACCMSEWVYFTHATAQLLRRNAAMNHGGGPSSNGGDLVNLAAWWSASLSPWFLSEISHLRRNVLCMSKTFNLVLANNDVKNPMRVPWGFRNRLRQTFPQGVLWIWINYLASDKWAKIDLEKTPSWHSEAAFWMDKLSQLSIGEPSLGRCHTADFEKGQEMAVFITGSSGLTV